MSASVSPLEQLPLHLWVACVIGLAAIWIALLLLDYHHRSRARNPMPRGRIISAMTVIHPQLDERLPLVQCPAPPPSPRLKRIYEPQEVDEKFSKELHALLKIEVNKLLPSRIPNSSLYTFPSYLFSPEKMVGWDSASRATQVQKRMLSDPRFIGVPEEDWENPQVWDPRDKHPIGGYEIDKNEYYEGTGGYFETWETWKKVKRGYWMEKLLGPTKKDKGNQPRGEDRSIIINIEGGPQSVVEEGGHQPVVEEGGGHQPVIEEGGGHQPVFEEVGCHQPIVEEVGRLQLVFEEGRCHQPVVEGGRPQFVVEDGSHPSVGRRHGSGSSSVHLANATDYPAHSMRQRGERCAS